VHSDKLRFLHILMVVWFCRLVKVPGIPTYQNGDMGILNQRVEYVRGMEWGMSTDIEAVFDRMLQIAQVNGMAPSVVAGLSVVIFSDMEFDQSRSDQETPWETAHETIKRKFSDAGYSNLPTIVYWNLRSSASVPVLADEPGVVMLAGFSASMMQAFLDRRLDDVTPLALLHEVLGKDCYARLQAVI